MNNLVSIIIPAYNVEEYISETIESIICQNHKDWELLLIDDGSIDNTKEIIKQYLELDSRIKYFYQENKGCSAAKNFGYRLAKGSYIQYLDADDILSSIKIEEQVKALQYDNFKVAVCRTKIFKYIHLKDEGLELDSDFLFDSNQPLEFLLNLYGFNGKIGMIQPNAFLISKQLAERTGPFDETISPSPDEDGEYFCRIILASTGIVYARNGINYYRKNDSKSKSLSNQVSLAHAKGALKSLILIYSHLINYSDIAKVKVQQTMAMHFSGFIYRYYFYKDLCDQAEAIIFKLNQLEIPLSGGNNFRRVATIFGFKRAIALKRCVRLLKKLPSFFLNDL